MAFTINVTFWNDKEFADANGAKHNQGTAKRRKLENRKPSSLALANAGVIVLGSTGPLMSMGSMRAIGLEAIVNNF